MFRHVERAALNGGQAARAWMLARGHTPVGQVLWSEADTRTLEAMWPDRDALRRLLPNRTLAAIEHKAAKLKLPTQRKLHWWTAAEASRYRRLWPAASRLELMEAFPWASWGGLLCYAQWQRKNGYPNLFRPRIPFRPTGDLVVDALMSEAFRLNLSLSDLDALARSGRFFASGRYRVRRNWRHLGSAVEALEGIIDVKFSKGD